MSGPGPVGAPAPAGDAIWGYGRYGDDQLLPLSYDDIGHDTAAAIRALRGLALPDRSLILLVAKVADVGHLHGVQEAARTLGHLVANADASGMDVERVALFTRLLPVTVVIGVNGEMLDGMADAGLDPKAVFSGIPIVLALESAFDRLVDLGLDPLRLELLGPALAMECRYRRMHVDGVLWSTEEVGGTLHLSSRLPRALTVEDLDTGRAGSVHQVVCPCGRYGTVISTGRSEQAGDPP